MTGEKTLHLFEGIGVELEYMIVHRDSLDTLPVCDRVIKHVAGEYVNEVSRGPLNWSNELVLHVIEFKTNGPVKTLDGLAGAFTEHAREVNAMLGKMDGQLMPTAMHPWMDPYAEMKLWPHEYSPIFEAFHRIFDCRGHGWANLQSAHINLPYHGDEEFGRLHAAIRLVLPLLPALAASSPIKDGRRAPNVDERLDVYRINCARIPSITGRIIPEPVFTPGQYDREILQRMYRDIAPFDEDGILAFEWLNARGAIARFERNTIEIRLLDVQECPAMDLAIGQLAVKTLEALVQERWCSWDDQMAWDIDPLAAILKETTIHGDAAAIRSLPLLRAFGYAGTHATARDLWRHIRDSLAPDMSEAELAVLNPVDLILSQGPLSRRIISALGESPDREGMLGVYTLLCDCLHRGVPFDATVHGATAHL